jgi:NAD(P)-dependent dehydrogenase (short-subunit alcohol dehydrogenase family)
MTTDARRAALASARREDVGDRPLDGMVALVSGGGRGLGKLLAARLAAAGAAVGLIARSADQLAAAAEEINRAGGVAAAAVADVTNQQATAAAVTELRERLGTRPRWIGQPPPAVPAVRSPWAGARCRAPRGCGSRRP